MANLVITNAGLKALVNASEGGTNAIKIASVQYGSGKYTASATQTKLTNSFKTLTTIAGGAVGDNIIHMEVQDTSSEAYTAYEVGVFLSNGTLFAVYSSTAPIVQKAASAVGFLAIDITVQGATPTSVTFGDTNFTNPPATTSTPGLIQIASVSEVVAGTQTSKAVTPANLKGMLENILGELITENGGTIPS